MIWAIIGNDDEKAEGSDEGGGKPEKKATTTISIINFFPWTYISSGGHHTTDGASFELVWWVSDGWGNVFSIFNACMNTGLIRNDSHLDDNLDPKEYIIIKARPG